MDKIELDDREEFIMRMDVLREAANQYGIVHDVLEFLVRAGNLMILSNDIHDDERELLKLAELALAGSSLDRKFNEETEH